MLALRFPCERILFPLVLYPILAVVLVFVVLRYLDWSAVPGSIAKRAQQWRRREVA